MADYLGKWIAVLLGAALLYGLWQACRPKWTTVIVLAPGGVESHRGLPRARQGEILEFLAKEISLQGRITIRVSRCRNGYLRTQFSGRVDQGTRQRIRNFLIRAL